LAASHGDAPPFLDSGPTVIPAEAGTQTSDVLSVSLVPGLRRDDDAWPEGRRSNSWPIWDLL